MPLRTSQEQPEQRQQQELPKQRRSAKACVARGMQAKGLRCVVRPVNAALGQGSALEAPKALAASLGECRPKACFASLGQSLRRSGNKGRKQLRCFCSNGRLPYQMKTSLAAEAISYQPQCYPGNRSVS